MDIAIKALQAIVSLSLLVFLHELGHFMFARLFKTRVEKFYLFFAPWFSLFKFKRGDTEYGIGWIPLGGYVKISGMIDESMDTEQMKQPAQPYEFRSKPAWQRLIIMVGGVVMNLLAAIVIYIGISYCWGKEYIANKDVTYGYVFSPLGQEMGFQNGDKIISLDGREVDNFAKIPIDILLDDVKTVKVDRNGLLMDIGIDSKYKPRLMKDKGFISPRMPFEIAKSDKEKISSEASILFQPGDKALEVNGIRAEYLDQVQTQLKENAGKEVDFSVLRGTDTVNYSVKVDEKGLIGVPIKIYDFKISKIEYNLFQAIPAGIVRAKDEVGSYWKQLKLIFTPETEAYKSLGGFIAIGSIFPDSWDWFSFWNITALLSIMFAVMNILPIPALDGGHVMFLIYEVITRRKPSDKFIEYAQMVGLIILFSLLLFANGNDIIKLFK